MKNVHWKIKFPSYDRFVPFFLFFFKLQAYLLAGISLCSSLIFNFYLAMFLITMRSLIIYYLK
ncbi:hypothetical protein HanXRQr2_Chr08g0355841 [Helianthus annuus]|uniref:Uncharacterized protein n=1 Tax=Helianthus annuus TaxID=4232 RepID=A0A9K3IHV6_HELAN|nr:hypothetical protein HanXRQr2_Chr08g0355841 [Helianthus annuus]KAJ0902976.1 hypothetical protein HanPSC8_Chr08g0343621 [Helianthus annuus]